MPVLTHNPKGVSNVPWLFHVNGSNLKSFYPLETKALSSDVYERISVQIQTTLSATVFKKGTFRFNL